MREFPRNRGDLTFAQREVLGTLANCWCTACHRQARDRGLMVR